MSDWPSPANDPLAVDGEPPKTPSDGDLPPAQAQPGGWQYVGLAALALLLAGLIASRFIGLDQSPPGFYVDEAAIAAQVMCLRSTGGDAQENPGRCSPRSWAAARRHPHPLPGRRLDGTFW